MIRVACATIFSAFSFVYLYFYQADVMAYVQYAASGGETRYQPLIGAVLITIVLQLLHSLVYQLAPLTKSTHAFTYFPSFLVLSVLTDVSPKLHESFSFGIWVWLFPSLLGVFAIVCYFLLELQTIETNDRSQGLMSRRMWINLFTMFFLMMMTGAIGTSNDSFHHRLRMENALRDSNMTRYQLVAPEAIATDSTLKSIKPRVVKKKKVKVVKHDEEKK